MEEKKHSKFKKIVVIGIFLLTGLVLWSRYLSTSGLVVKEYSVINKELPESFNGFKIIHFTDLHYGRTVDLEVLKNLVREINILKPQMVVFTGDLIDKDINVNKEKEEEITEALKTIDAEIIKLSIKGNHDYYNDIPYVDIMKNAGFEVLDNDALNVYYKSTMPILIVGLSSSIKDFPDYSKALENSSISLEEAQKQFTIVLAHEPDQIKSYQDYDIELMLSGHSHNGQIRFPFFGAVIKSYGSRTYYDPYYKVNDTDLYISGGIGVSSYNFRFLNKPSFNLYRLYNS